MDYDLELNKVVKQINKLRPKTVLVQLPDGLKPRAKEIVDEIEAKTKSKVMIWMGSCFGSCDVPTVKVDLIIQWGHTK